MIYSPSLACANQINLESDILDILDCKIDWLHFDIMDGHYVPNLCLSLDTLRAIKRKFPDVVIDTHIMVTNPEAYIQLLAEAGAQNVAFHNDATRFSYRTLQSIHKYGMKAGVVLNPSQDTTSLLPVIELLDYVLIMSIEPGFAGQKFIESSYSKIETLVRIRKEQKLDFLISVDGGITAEIARKLKELGTDVIVLGYPAIFNQPDGIKNSFLRYTTIIER